MSNEQTELMRLAQELQGSKTKVVVQKREITSLNARVVELIRQLQEAEAKTEAMANRMEWTVTDNAKKAIQIADLQAQVEQLKKGPQP